MRNSREAEIERPVNPLISDSLYNDSRTDNLSLFAVSENRYIHRLYSEQILLSNANDEEFVDRQLFVRINSVWTIKI